jgi:hypothetical protein
VSAHEDAWPFKQAVKHEDAPDYHEIVKNPIDLSMIHERTSEPHRHRPFGFPPEPAQLKYLAGSSVAS